MATVPMPLKFIQALQTLSPPKRASGTVPLPRFVALSAVRLTPDAAGSVAGNLASGKVPDVKSLALVEPAVSQVPSPHKKTPLLAVPDPSLAVGTVPLARLVALRFVRLAPLPDKGLSTVMLPVLSGVSMFVTLIVEANYFLLN